MTCRTDRHLLSFVFFEHNMILDYIEPIQMDSKLKGIFVESMNVRNGLRTRKL